MTSDRARDRPIGMVGELLATAAGRRDRDNPIRARAGGPAGNARLTSWTGLVLLALLAVEGATLVQIGRLIGLHVAIGFVIIPPVVLKTASTGWRIARYYAGDEDYVRAGPPPVLLRVLGPLVVASTVAVLASGVALVVEGARGLDATFRLGGIGVSAATLHKASFLVWVVLMTVHVLTRTLPALRTLVGKSPGRVPVPGGARRIGAVTATLLSGVLLGVVVLASASWWTTVWNHGRR